MSANAYPLVGPDKAAELRPATMPTTSNHLSIVDVVQILTFPACFVRTRGRSMMWVLLVAVVTQAPDGQWRSEGITATGDPTLAMCREARAGEIKADMATADLQ